MYILSTRALTNARPYFPPWIAAVAAVSPVLEYGLIRYVSGVPLLEVRSPFRAALFGVLASFPCLWPASLCEFWALEDAHLLLLLPLPSLATKQKSGDEKFGKE